MKTGVRHVQINAVGGAINLVIEPVCLIAHHIVLIHVPDHAQRF